jgi:hypothetical protein
LDIEEFNNTIESKSMSSFATPLSQKRAVPFKSPLMNQRNIDNFDVVGL